MLVREAHDGLLGREDKPASDALARAGARDGPRLRGRRAMPESFDALAADLAASRRPTSRATRASARRVASTRGPSRGPRRRRPFPPRRSSSRASSPSTRATPPSPFARAARPSEPAAPTPCGRAASYDAAALAFGARCSRAGSRLAASVSPSSSSGRRTSRRPDSSLSHMCALFARAFGAGGDGATFFVRGRRARGRRAARPRCVAAARRPALVLATSFAPRPLPRRDGRTDRGAPAGQPRDADGRLQGPIARGLGGRAAPRRSRRRSRSTSAPSSPSTG